MEVVREGEQERPGRQAAERALQVEEVGGAAADVGAVVGHVGEELAAVLRAAQGLHVGVQDGDVAAVAGQGVEGAGAGGRSDPEGGNDDHIYNLTLHLIIMGVKVINLES